MWPNPPIAKNKPDQSEMPVFPPAEAGAGLYLPNDTALSFPKKNNFVFIIRLI